MAGSGQRRSARVAAGQAFACLVERGTRAART
jgi:hypothetical protein